MRSRLYAHRTAPTEDRDPTRTQIQSSQTEAQRIANYTLHHQPHNLRIHTSYTHTFLSAAHSRSNNHHKSRPTACTARALARGTRSLKANFRSFLANFHSLRTPKTDRNTSVQTHLSSPASLSSHRNHPNRTQTRKTRTACTARTWRRSFASNPRKRR